MYFSVVVSVSPLPQMTLLYAYIIIIIKNK